MALGVTARVLVEANKGDSMPRVEGKVRRLPVSPNHHLFCPPGTAIEMQPSRRDVEWLVVDDPHQTPYFI